MRQIISWELAIGSGFGKKRRESRLLLLHHLVVCACSGSLPRGFGSRNVPHTWIAACFMITGGVSGMSPQRGWIGKYDGKDGI
jgi:hypothetical protein